MTKQEMESIIATSLIRQRQNAIRELYRVGEVFCLVVAFPRLLDY